LGIAALEDKVVQQAMVTLPSVSLRNKDSS
jgi:hypothetical protein